MKILHISDNHGYFESIDRYDHDVLISSGDFFKNIFNAPSLNKQLEKKEYERQLNWLTKNYNLIKSWSKKKIIFCSGNHDYINYSDKYFINCTNKLINYKGYKIYGFPYIPLYSGRWNYELALQPTMDIVFSIKKQINNIDILITHCPPRGTLDFVPLHGYYGSFGVKKLIELLNPKIVLCGHVHSGYGFKYDNGILYSNAAIGDNPLELKPRLIKVDKVKGKIITKVLN